MLHSLRPLVLVLAPTAVGLALRFSEFATANSALTQTAGRVHPAEVANALSRGDEVLALGLIGSVAGALIWLFASFARTRAEQLACGLVLVGLVTAIGGTRQLGAVNHELAEDFEAAVTTRSSLEDEAALDLANEAYLADYADDGPVRSSVQFAAVIPQLERPLSTGRLFRRLGLALAVLAALFKVRSVRTVADLQGQPAG